MKQRKALSMKYNKMKKGIVILFIISHVSSKCVLKRKHVDIFFYIFFPVRMVHPSDTKRGSSIDRRLLLCIKKN